ncbi:MAG TPA: efflux RND transporter periplasmic adaptor subunit [Chthoniobacteraceae bacterium]|jgi:Cu(I)/Ag(I) efflux system membrane fusion protein|nr:efflux RND transporter periplasmic adaptor subunit [Chthoniobacteraceae bacterium]
MNHSRRTVLKLFLLSGASLSLAGCFRREAVIPDNVDYYTCTMHPSVRSYDPHGKCPICGMDLVPVYKKGAMAQGPAMGASMGAGVFTVPVERQQQIGVTYTTVERRPLHSSIRAVGLVEYDTSRHWTFVARTDGYVSQLFVTSPGEIVDKGEALLSLYSPDLLTTERELVLLLRMRDQAKSPDVRDTPLSLIEAAKERLIQWNVTPDQLVSLEKTRQPEDHLTLYSPYHGIVQGIPAQQGMSVKIGDQLLDVADLSQVWVWAELYEDEMAAFRQGQKVAVTVNSFPGRIFEGKVSVINPFVDESTRTTRVRIDIANPDFALRPGMYANVELGREMGQGLTIPVDAIMPTGNRNIVFVDRGEGRLAPRAVRLGGKFGDYYQVLDGLTEGERVVSSANFLIDAESKVQGALKDFDNSDWKGAGND